MAGRTLLQGGVVAHALVHKRDPMSLAVDLLKAGPRTPLPFGENAPILLSRLHGEWDPPMTLLPQTHAVWWSSRV